MTGPFDSGDHLLPGAEELYRTDSTHLWHPWSMASATHPILVKGEGCHVTDIEGRRFLDARGGALNAVCGYGRKEIVEAIAAQAQTLMVADLGSTSNVPAILLAQRLAGLLPAPLRRTFFCSSGSEASETAIKPARVYHALRGEPERQIVVSLDAGYHGATMGSAALTSAPFVRELTGAAPAEFRSVPAPTRQRVAEHGDRAGADLAHELEELVERAGPGRVAMFIMEPVLGIAGVVVPPPGYLERIASICRRHGILLVLDEVLTGFGRTGRMFGLEHSGVVPDMVTTSKGLSGGYLPLAALTTTQEIYDVTAHDPLLGGFRHGHTMAGHPVACRAALATIDVIVGEGLVVAADQLGRRLRQRLRRLDESPIVVEVRGLGLLIGIEFPDQAAAVAVTAAARDRGLIVRCQGPTVTLCPPLVLAPDEADEIAEIMVAAVEAVTAAPAGAG